MKYIPDNDRDYGIKALERKLSRLKSKEKELEEKDLSRYGYMELGRIKEAIYIYEDILDLWNRFK